MKIQSRTITSTRRRFIEDFSIDLSETPGSILKKNHQPGVREMRMGGVSRILLEFYTHGLIILGPPPGEITRAGHQEWAPGRSSYVSATSFNEKSLIPGDL